MMSAEKSILSRSQICGDFKMRYALRRGSNVEILEEETWLKVRARDGSIGYVSSDYIEKEELDLVDHRDEPNPVDTDLVNLLPLLEKEQDQCIIKSCSNSQFIGKQLRVDVDFIPHLDRLNKYAQDCAVQIYVTSSAREPGRTVTGAIVKPASRSNHMVGHAIDMNLQCTSGFYNSKKLKNSNFANLPAEIQNFLNLVRQDEILRWGGDFSKQDPLHIDDNLNHRNAERWDQKYQSRNNPNA